MGMIRCRDCQRLRRHIEILRDRNGELELRLEGALQRVRLAAAARAKDSDQTEREGDTSWSSDMLPETGSEIQLSAGDFSMAPAC
jgi:hypothetical protein